MPLTETIGDGRESVRKIRADQAHGGNDDERDQAGDEGVFDGRDARIIADKLKHSGACPVQEGAARPRLQFTIELYGRSAWQSHRWC